MRQIMDRRPYPVAMMTLDEKVIRIFPNMTEASRRTGVPASSISAVCTGINNTAKGYKWKKLITQEELEDAKASATLQG